MQLSADVVNVVIGRHSVNRECMLMTSDVSQTIGMLNKNKLIEYASELKDCKRWVDNKNGRLLRDL